MSEHKWRNGGRSTTDVRGKMLYHGRVGKKAYWRGRVVWEKTYGDPNAVRFFDFDGAILYAMSAAAFLRLSDWPPGIHPSQDTDTDTETGLHKYLRDDGWNWTLEAAQAHVALCGYLDIGALYASDYIVVHVEATESQKTLYIRWNGTAEIDYGDGASETLTWNTWQAKSHAYADAGKYVVKIAPSGTIVLGGHYAQRVGSSYQYVPYTIHGQTTGNGEIYRYIHLSAGVSGQLIGALRYTYGLKGISVQRGAFNNNNLPYGILDNCANFNGPLIIPPTLTGFASTSQAQYARLATVGSVVNMGTANNLIGDNSSTVTVGVQRYPIIYPYNWVGAMDYVSRYDADRYILPATATKSGYVPRSQHAAFGANMIAVARGPDGFTLNLLPNPKGENPKFVVPSGYGDAWRTKLGASHAWHPYVTEAGAS